MPNRIKGEGGRKKRRNRVQKDNPNGAWNRMVKMRALINDYFVGSIFVIENI